MGRARRLGRAVRRRPARWLLPLAALALLALLLRPIVIEQLRLQLGLHRARELAPVLLAAARESGLDPYLLAGLMAVESSGRVDARSEKDALGLFQLKLATAGEVAGKLGLPPPSEQQLLSDAALNARLGAHYLATMIERFGRAAPDAVEGVDVEPALVAYNTGPTRLARMLDEAGGWNAWRAERERAGSALLSYAERVLRHRDYYREELLFDSPEAAAH